MMEQPNAMGGFYTQYLESLCRRRGWHDPAYECYRDANGYTCLVLVNGRAYQTDLAYASDNLAQENAAMRAFMVCRNFSVNGGMLARNGIVQGLPASNELHARYGGGGVGGAAAGVSKKSSSSSPASASRVGGGHHHHHHHHQRESRGHRSGQHSSSSSTASYE